ncbi:MAG: DUF3891 family protein [Planctomycetota bacterium]|nr:MAG: DUF3891 family protein [Planctomycetota bacterium]
MIRRDLPAEGSEPARWAIIGQIDHARLSGRLAEHWGAGGFAPLVPRDALLWAIEHHDDGWRAWDAAPGVDPERGRPRSFTEMEVPDAVAIWVKSIEAAATAGPLEAALVAGHFCALQRRATSFHQDDPAWAHAEAFLAEYEAKIDRWLADWQAADPVANTPAVAERALRQLQFFDLLSLWFCCSRATEPEVLQTPSGQELTLTPLDSQRVGLSPWPLEVGSLAVEVPARAVRVRHYESREDLATAASEPLVLRWELVPRRG